MSKRFENVAELGVTATPEQVWDAIATGPPSVSRRNRS